MIKYILILSVWVASFYASVSAEAVIFVDVFKDAYIEDFTRDQNTPPDGTPDEIIETNALIASRGEFFDEFNAFNVDSHVIMTFDVDSYAGRQLASAYLTGFGTRVDNKGLLDPITGEFYMYSGDAFIDLADFNSPASFIGSRQFQAHSQGFDLDPFEIDITSSLQEFLNHSMAFVEFRVESESSSVFINAGEVEPSSGYSLDTRWSGPRLALTFNDSAAVPEPATLLMLGSGLAVGFFRKRKKSNNLLMKQF